MGEFTYICARMSKNKKYTFNDRTLMYEIRKRSRMSQVFKSATIFALSLGMAVFYFWLYTSVLGLELPKTVLLKKQNAEWCSKMEVMNRQLDSYEDALASLQMRDDDIYRYLPKYAMPASEVSTDTPIWTVWIRADCSKAQL